MIRTRSPAAALIVSGASALFLAGPAQAKPPPSAPTALFCPPDLQNGQVIREPDGSVLSCTEALGAGAVVVRNGVVLQQVIAAPGWTWQNHGGSATSGKVDIRFENATIGGKVRVLLEPGKSVVTGS